MILLTFAGCATQTAPDAGWAKWGESNYARNEHATAEVMKPSHTTPLVVGVGWARK